MPITGDPNEPEFTSEHQYLLFLSLPVFRQLAPELLNSLLELCAVVQGLLALGSTTYTHKPGKR